MYHCAMLVVAGHISSDPRAGQVIYISFSLHFKGISNRSHRGLENGEQELKTIPQGEDALVSIVDFCCYWFLVVFLVSIDLKTLSSMAQWYMRNRSDP